MSHVPTNLMLSGESFECLRCLDHLEYNDHTVFLLKHDGVKYYSFLFCEMCGNNLRFSEHNLVKRIEIPKNSDVTSTLESHGIFKKELAVIPPSLSARPKNPTKEIGSF